MGPPAGDLGSMVYDEVRKKVLLLNGYGGGTWEWDGDFWVQVADTGPHFVAGNVAYASVGLAYDRGRQRVVAAQSGETWEWDGGAWTQVADTGAGKTSRLAYVDARTRTVSVRFDEAKAFLETWEWDGAVWTQVADTGPSFRTEFDVSYDAKADVVVLFGRQASPPAWTNFGDTWVWNGSVWKQLEDIGPSPRICHRMVYDIENRQTVLFGGMFAQPPNANTVFSDTWQWDGSRWAEMQNMGPSARLRAGMAYDSDRLKVVLFGGITDPALNLGDTWELGTYDDAGPPPAPPK